MNKFSDFALSADYVRARLNYEPQTGLLTWRKPPNRHGQRLGRDAGSIRVQKEKVSAIVKLDGVSYQHSRVAWLHFYGVHAIKQIDHIDGNRLNNSINNLRLAEQCENMLNIVRKRGKAGLPQGVAKIRCNGKFFARATHNGKTQYIGTFQTKEEAHIAYKQFCDATRGQFSPTKRL